MSIRIPIISEFDERGITKASKEFANLETNGQRAGYALEKSFLPAVAVVGALGAGLVMAAKAAAQDEAAQAELARQLKATTGATDAAVKTNEQFISTISKATARADDDLRPALANLVRATGDLSQSQKALAVTSDLAYAKNIDLETASNAVGKALAGNTTALIKMVPSLKGVIDGSSTAEEVMAALNKTVGGASTTFANTAEGSLKNLGIQFGEVKESIGAALIPVMEKLLPYLIDAAGWMQENTDVIIALIVAVGGLATAIVAANIAMKAYNVLQTLTTAANVALGNSFTYAAGSKASGIGFFSAAAGIAILTITEAYGLFNDKSAFSSLILSFRQAGQAIAATAVFIANQFANAFIAVNNGVAKMLNDIIYGINLLSPFTDIPSIPMQSYNPIKQPSFFYGGGGGGTAYTGDKDLGVKIGGSTASVSAGLGGGLPAPSGGGGGGGGAPKISSDIAKIAAMPTLVQAPTINNPGPQFGIQERMANMGDVTVNVEGGLSSSAEIGQAVVDAIRAYNRAAGPADILVGFR